MSKTTTVSQRRKTKNAPVPIGTEGVNGTKRGTTSASPKTHVFRPYAVQSHRLRAIGRTRPTLPAMNTFRRQLEGVFTKHVSLPFSKRKLSVQAMTSLLIPFIANERTIPYLFRFCQLPCYDLFSSKDTPALYLPFSAISGRADRGTLKRTMENLAYPINQRGRQAGHLPPLLLIRFPILKDIIVARQNRVEQNSGNCCYRQTGQCN